MIVGEGMVCFGVPCATDFTNLKWSTKIPRGRPSLPTIFSASGDTSVSPSLVWNRILIEDGTRVTFANEVRKSMCHSLRRNSPSVASLRPTSSCSFTTSRMLSSSTFVSSARDRAFFWNASRASRSFFGRSRLPTWSARNGGFVRSVMASLPKTLADIQPILRRRATGSRTRGIAPTGMAPNSPFGGNVVRSRNGGNSRPDKGRGQMQKLKGFAWAALAALVFGAAPAMADTVKVGVVLPYSGAFAGLTAVIDNAIKLWVKEHGDSAGGTKIELIRRDTGGPNPEVAKRLSQELIAR